MDEKMHRKYYANILSNMFFVCNGIFHKKNNVTCMMIFHNDLDCFFSHEHVPFPLLGFIRSHFRLRKVSRSKHVRLRVKLENGM